MGGTKLEEERGGSRYRDSAFFFLLFSNFEALLSNFRGRKSMIWEERQEIGN